MGGTRRRGRRVRVQLRLRDARASPRAVARRLVLAARRGRARAQVAEFDTAHSVFYEAPTQTHMIVYSPSARPPGRTVRLAQGARGLGGGRRVGRERRDEGRARLRRDPRVADVITTASVHDFRNLGTRRRHAHERDTSRSRGLRVFDRARLPVELASTSTARTELFAAQHAVRDRLRAKLRQRLRSRAGRRARRPRCTRRSRTRRAASRRAATRTTDPIDIDSFQASWSQAWTPMFATQLTYTRADPRRLPARPVPQRHPRRRHEGAGARARRTGRARRSPSAATSSSSR